MTLRVYLKLKSFCKDYLEEKKKRKEKSLLCCSDFAQVQSVFKNPFKTNEAAWCTLQDRRVVLIAAAIRGHPAGGEC